MAPICPQISLGGGGKGLRGRESKPQIAPYPPQPLTWHGCQHWELLVWPEKPLPDPTVITGCLWGSGASCNNSLVSRGLRVIMGWTQSSQHPDPGMSLQPVPQLPAPRTWLRLPDGLGVCALIPLPAKPRHRSSQISVCGLQRLSPCSVAGALGCAGRGCLSKKRVRAYYNRCKMCLKRLSA